MDSKMREDMGMCYSRCCDSNSSSSFTVKSRAMMVPSGANKIIAGMVLTPYVLAERASGSERTVHLICKSAMALLTG